MARCVHCDGGKAKRPCPALGANVCSRCCGQHQRQVIDCPSACSYLRGAPDNDAYRSAVDKLLDFVMGFDEFGEAATKAYFGGKRELDEWEQPLLLGYFAYGYENEDGDRAVDIFLRDHRQRLRADEQEALTALQSTAWYSMFEVQEVEIDHGLHLLDLATGERIFVHEKALTHQVTRLDISLGWVVELGDHYELTGSLSGVPMVHRDGVLKTLRRELKKARKYGPGTDDKILMRRVIPAVQKKLRKLIKDWVPPRMVTMDGEDIVFCEAIFDVNDSAAVSTQLRKHPDFDEDGDDFIWLDRAGRKQLGSGSLHLGVLKFRGQRLVLETQSRERLERGKQVLSEYLGDMIRHRLDSVKDLDVAMAEYAANPPPGPSPDELPPELQAELLGQFMQDHMKSWIDEPIPMLKGKTPRQAVRTKGGKAKVLEMLKDQEHIYLKTPGGDGFDLSPVYDELGLPRP